MAAATGVFSKRYSCQLRLPSDRGLRGTVVLRFSEMVSRCTESVTKDSISSRK